MGNDAIKCWGLVLKGWLVAICLGCVSAVPVFAHERGEVADIKFDGTLRLFNTNLQLNGAGLRKKFFFKVYAIGLYLPQHEKTAQAVIMAKGPKRIQIVTLRELSAEQLANAMLEALQKNNTAAQMNELQARIAQFRATLLSIGDSKEKSLINLDYIPAAGTRLTVDLEEKGHDIPGEDFYQALLRVWLGDHPVQDDLKDALLDAAH